MVGSDDRDNDSRDSTGRPDDSRLTDTTAHHSKDFEQQLAALDGEVSTEEQDAIGALPSGSALLVVRRGPNTGARFLLDADVRSEERRVGKECRDRRWP